MQALETIHAENAKEVRRREDAEHEQLANMTLEEAKRILSNDIYKACSLLEKLEGKQKITGNGHHMAQDICTLATERLGERWIG